MPNDKTGWVKSLMQGGVSFDAQIYFLFLCKPVIKCMCKDYA